MTGSEPIPDHLATADELLAAIGSVADSDAPANPDQIRAAVAYTVACASVDAARSLRVIAAVLTRAELAEPGRHAAP